MLAGQPERMRSELEPVLGYMQIHCRSSDVAAAPHEGLLDLLAGQVVRPGEPLVGRQQRVQRRARDAEEIRGRGAPPPGFLERVEDLFLGEVLRLLALSSARRGSRG